MDMTLEFAMNRTCAPGRSLGDFIALARGAGVRAVEIRNDIEGREFADGTKADVIRAQLDAAGLAVASVNALQRFNEWTDARAAEARHLVGYAKGLGAPGLVLCPVHTPETWSGAEAERNLRDGLRQLAPILRDAGVKGYVEPLGMRHSTMKRQDMAVAAVGDIDGWDCYELCYDTFQFYRCGDDVWFPERIGLVHISGISRTDLTPGELSEPDRGLVFGNDRVGNVERLLALKAAGYAGFVSIEPFDPAVLADPELPARLRETIAHVGAAVGIAGGR